MSYCEIQEDVRQHIYYLINWIHNEVLSAGGDGDFLWYSEFYDVKDVFQIVNEFNENVASKWWDVTLGGETIYAGHGQEGFTITNDKTRYLNAPSWQQGLLKY